MEKILSVTIKDCDFQTFRAGGKGGQHQNKTESGVRIIHRPSGAVGESREHKSQLQNKKAAFKRMAESYPFQRWLKLAILEESPEEKVDRMMMLENLKIESRQDGVWVTQDKSR